MLQNKMEELLLAKVNNLEPDLYTYMSIENYVNTILIQQFFHCYSHTLYFSIMGLVGAIPRGVPCSNQPWSHFSVNIS